MSQGGESLRYRGSLKHKRWHPGGGYGTLCPNWTHQAGEKGCSGNTESHAWQRTAAHEMFEASTLAEDGRRYATRNGIAFVAVNSNDGTWHGYPIPWQDVPTRSGAVSSIRAPLQGAQSADRRSRQATSNGHWTPTMTEDDNASEPKHTVLGRRFGHPGPFRISARWAKDH